MSSDELRGKNPQIILRGMRRNDEQEIIELLKDKVPREVIQCER